MLFWMALASLHGLVVNEILYDPPGADGDHEFVELINPTAAEIVWEGLRLEAGDGAHPGSWKVIFSSTAGRLPPGGILLLGGSQVGGAPLPLAGNLQNGPDAVRLLLDDRVIDVVGYGNLTDASLFEGQPAADVSGKSLSRLPDGRDTQNNAADLQATEPTPGRRNAAIVDWRVHLQEPAWYRMWPGRRIVMEGELENVGWGKIPSATWRLAARLLPVQEVSGDTLVQSELSHELTVAVAAEDLQRGASLPFTVSWTGESGLFLLVVEALGEDEWAPDNRVELLGRIGAGQVVINEILYAPLVGQQEWIELWNRSAEPCDLLGWSLTDASGRRALFAANAPLLPNGYALARYDTVVSVPGQNLAALNVSARPWPSLNNTDDELGIAETLVLRDAAGLLQDAVFYSGDNVVRGRSLERVHADPDVRGILWSLSKDPQGTTAGRVNSAAGRPGDRPADIELFPNPFSPDGDGVEDLLQINIDVPTGHQGFRAQVFDLHGRRRRDLAGDRLGAGLRRLVWDGLDDSGNHVEMGVYVLHLESFIDDGAPHRSLRTIGVVRP